MQDLQGIDQGVVVHPLKPAPPWAPVAARHVGRGLQPHDSGPSALPFRSVTLERELRDTSDSLLRALDALHALEAQKRIEPVGSPQFVELARRVEDLALEVLRRSEREADLAETTDERRDAGGGVGRPIEAISAQPRDLGLILNEWRAAERRLVASDAASTDASAAASDVRRLREEYRMAYEARTQRRSSGS